MSLSEQIRGIRAGVLTDLGEFLLGVGSLRIACKFYARHREVPAGDNVFVGVSLSLDLQLDAENTAAIAALEEGDPLEVVATNDEDGTERSLGTFKFFRRLPRAGTESGLIVLELHA